MLQLAEARAKRDNGIAVAAAHADRECDNWTSRAYGFLLEWIATSRAPDFLAEEVKEFAERRGFDRASDSRAWGAVFQRAAKLGVIERIGYAPAKSSNCSPKCLWRAA